MQLVGPGLGDHVNDTTGGPSILCAVGGGFDTKLPYRIHAKRLPGDTAGNLVRGTHHIGSVEQKAILFRPGSADRYLGCVATLHGANAREFGHRDPRLQLGQLVKAASVER